MHGPGAPRQEWPIEMHNVSQIASTPRVLHSTSIDTTALQNLDGSDISMDDSELPNFWRRPLLRQASGLVQSITCQPGRPSASIRMEPELPD